MRDLNLTFAIALASFVLLNGCATVSSSTRVATSINAKQFNSIASRYMDRPTLSAVDQMSDGVEVLYVQVEDYGSADKGIRFSKSNVSSYVQLIDKFLSWENQAISRGDILEKDIGRAVTWGNGTTVDLKFSFHSANEANHLLVVSFCAYGNCLDEWALYFDRVNAINLKDALTKFSNGQLSKDVSADYK